MAEAKKATAKKKTDDEPKKKAAKKVSEKPVKEAKEVVKAKKEDVKNGATKKSDTAKNQADTQRKEVESRKQEEQATAKAGKRSAKALKEAEEQAVKEQRKAESVKPEEEKKPKVQQKPARSKLERRGKSFRKAAELIEKGKVYTLAEALGLSVKTSPVKFDATVEMHIRLGVDPRQADQNIRDTVAMPSGTGKAIRVAVFADPDNVAAAKKAGADIAAADEFLQQLDKGTLDFDMLIATPGQMPKLGKYARLLGPKGLMPNPKSGTVTNDIAKAVGEAKAGRVEYRVDSTGIVHLGIGKVSFGDKKLLDNANAVLTSIKANKPSSLKGIYIRSIHVTTTMGPSAAVASSEA